MLIKMFRSFFENYLQAYLEREKKQRSFFIFYKLLRHKFEIWKLIFFLLFLIKGENLEELDNKLSKFSQFCQFSDFINSKIDYNFRMIIFPLLSLSLNKASINIRHFLFHFLNNKDFVILYSGFKFWIRFADANLNNNISI